MKGSGLMTVGDDGDVSERRMLRPIDCWRGCEGVSHVAGIGIDDGIMKEGASHALGDRGWVNDGDHRRWQLAKRVHRGNAKGLGVQFFVYSSFCLPVGHATE